MACYRLGWDDRTGTIAVDRIECESIDAAIAADIRAYVEAHGPAEFHSGPCGQFVIGQFVIGLRRCEPLLELYKYYPDTEEGRSACYYVRNHLRLMQAEEREALAAKAGVRFSTFSPALKRRNFIERRREEERRLERKWLKRAMKQNPAQT